MTILKNQFVPLALAVIAELPENFSAHYFIKRFMKHNEREYIAWLQETSETKGTPSGIFQEVHRQIGLALSNYQHELQIAEEPAKIESVNCFGDTDIISAWHKI